MPREPRCGHIDRRALEGIAIDVREDAVLDLELRESRGRSVRIVDPAALTIREGAVVRFQARAAKHVSGVPARGALHVHIPRHAIDEDRAGILRAKAVAVAVISPAPYEAVVAPAHKTRAGDRQIIAA